MYRTTNTNVVRVDATSNADHAKAFTLKVTHSTPDSGDVVYSTVTINIGFCVITHIQEPDIPDPSVVDYIIFDTMNSWTVTPEFTQVPACGYAIQETLEWTIQDNAPFLVDPADPYTMTSESYDGLNDHNTYTLIL